MVFSIKAKTCSTRTRILDFSLLPVFWSSARMYGKVIEAASHEHLKEFMIANVNPYASVRTDGWVGYSGMESEFPGLVKVKSEKKGINFKEMHRIIMMFKAWLRGVHHSVKNLQAYVDEYCYRFNRHLMKRGIFENLMTRMVGKGPYTYQLIKNDYELCA